MSEMPGGDDPRMVAAVDLLRRTGAGMFGLRYQDDMPPVVWIAVAAWGDHHECAAALDPVRAALRLCEQVIDGGQCGRCGKPSGFEPDETGQMPGAAMVCWNQWDADQAKYVPGCAR